MARPTLGFLAVAASLRSIVADAATYTITSEPEHSINPNLYSIFFETEINFGSEGGLYAELLHNRDFERLGRDKWGDKAASNELVDHPGLDPHEPPAIPTDFSPWKPIGSAVVSIENSWSDWSASASSSSSSFSARARAGCRPLLVVRGPVSELRSDEPTWGAAVAACRGRVGDTTDARCAGLRFARGDLCNMSSSRADPAPCVDMVLVLGARRPLPRALRCLRTSGRPASHEQEAGRRPGAQTRWTRRPRVGP